MGLSGVVDRHGLRPRDDGVGGLSLRAQRGNPGVCSVKWIATAFGLAMTGWGAVIASAARQSMGLSGEVDRHGLRPRDDGVGAGRHCERSAAIQGFVWCSGSPRPAASR